MSKPTSKDPKPTAQIFTRLDPEVYEALKKIAERERRSVSAEARRGLEQHVEREKAAA